MNRFRRLRVLGGTCSGAVIKASARAVCATELGRCSLRLNISRLRIGSVATALASKARDTDDGSADRKQMDAAIGNIEKRLGNLDDIRTWAQTVESNGKKIVQQTETMRKAIERELDSLRGEVDKLDA